MQKITHKRIILLATVLLNTQQLHCMGKDTGESPFQENIAKKLLIINTDKGPIIVSGTNNGRVFVWDASNKLEEYKVANTPIDSLKVKNTEQGLNIIVGSQEIKHTLKTSNISENKISECSRKILIGEEYRKEERQVLSLLLVALGLGAINIVTCTVCGVVFFLSKYKIKRSHG